MFEFKSVQCVLHGEQPVLPGRNRLPHPLWVAALTGCSLPTAEALVERECVVSVLCGCVYIHDVTIALDLIKAEGGAR